MIEVKNLTKTFKLSKEGRREQSVSKKDGLFTAVSDISFTCQPGRVLSLLGPNGAGKTTTLRILATILKSLALKVT